MAATAAQEQTFVRTQDPALTAALKNLGPESYTAHRLKHASSEHLYLTTRRCFVGPIPEGWLKTHRKEWYKHYLSVNRGDKVPSFEASSNQGRQRRITGLDGPSASAAFRASFPQPDNADDSGNVFDHDEEDEDEDDSNTIRQINTIETVHSADSDDAATITSPSALEIPRAANNPEDVNLRRGSGRHAEDALSSYNTAKTLISPPTPTTPRPAAPKRGESQATSYLSLDRRPTSGSTSARSFETASEGSGILIEEPGASLNRPTSDDEGSDQNDGQETPRPLDFASADPFRDGLLTPGNGGATSSMTSASPLLHTKSPSNDRGQPARTDSETADPHSAQDDVQPETEDLVSPAKRPRLSGLVRFAEPDVQPMKRELQMRAKLAQHAYKRIPGRFTRGKLRDGEIVKMEKMLVRVDVTSGSEQPNEDYDEKDSQRVETRTTQKWSEFMVVCRESNEEDAVLCLQMYKTRVIPASNKTKTKKHFEHEIPLIPQKVGANLYSALDKTLVLWQPKGLRSTIVFLRPRSSASAVEWYTFLRSVLGWQRANSLIVNIPDLRVSLRIANPFAQFDLAKNVAAAAEGDEEAMARTLEEEQAIAGKIIDICMNMLTQAGEWNHVLSKWAQYDRVGLAWKRYDRLEWIHGANERKMYGTLAMQRTHELELRPKQHYPTQIKTLAGEHMAEPAPVEGFLIRLTSQKGNEQKLGKLFYKRLYFTTHNQYLLFLRPTKAVPPPPPKMPMQANSKIPTVKQISEKIPLVYSVNPYPTHDDTISWLSPGALKPAEMQKHDQDAYDEAERNVQALLNCDGFINLCDVVKVRKMRHGATPADQNVDSGSDVDFDAEVNDTHRDDGATSGMDDDRTFELVMHNGLVVRLQAFSKATKKEWMKRLRALVLYWSIRTTHDMDLFKSVRRENLTTLNIDERLEAYVGQFAKKWEVTNSFASSEQYNMCGISSCRSIHRSGVLFRKPRLHKTFTRCHVILCHGHLVIFEDTLRKVTGKKVVHIHHERIACIDLKDCYLYSGLITENDLLYQNRTFDSNMPGNHALPRMYAEDNWTSTDEDAMTCFVIWHSQRKGWFRGSKDQDDVKEGRKHDERNVSGKGGKREGLKRVSQLGVPGRSIVFKARSRAERDHWVMGIADEIERVGTGDDVRVVGGED